MKYIRRRLLRDEGRRELKRPRHAALYSKGLCEKYELPHWYEGYVYVRRGYRVGYCRCDCVRSVGSMHNETCNIWSHMTGAIVFAVRGIRTIWTLLICLFTKREDLIDVCIDELAALCFIISATAMFSCSAGYHTMYPVSPQLCAFWRRLDVTGIALMIAGSVACGIWLGFKCEPIGIRIFWLGFFILSAIALILSQSSSQEFENTYDEPQPQERSAYSCAPWFICLWQQTKRRNDNKHLLPLLSLGLSCFAPAVHWIAVAPVNMRNALAPGLGMMAFFYIAGLFFYFSHWPERIAPGRFDYFGASHQLWHLCVLLAALAWLFNAEFALSLFRQQREPTQYPDFYAALFNLPVPLSLNQFVSSSTHAFRNLSNSHLDVLLTAPSSTLCDGRYPGPSLILADLPAASK